MNQLTKGFKCITELFWDLQYVNAYTRCITGQQKLAEIDQFRQVH